MNLYLDELDSTIGRIRLVANDTALCALDFADCEPRMTRILEARFGATIAVRRSDPHGFSSRVRAYLEGELDALDGLPADPGGTPFQSRVWSALQRIPCGSTTSYAEIARALGRPNAARAVGAANARNPIALVLPCHRVVGADGSLSGYAGGLARKRWLLAHEGIAIG